MSDGAHSPGGRGPLRPRSAHEVVEEALAAVDAGDGEFHSFLIVLADEARAEADAIDAAVAAGKTRARSPACRWR